MKVLIDKSFEKDVRKITDKSLLNKIADCIEHVEEISLAGDIRGLKKLKGSNTYFRIRIGDYRIGLMIEKSTVTFVRFLHRREIYNYFP
jgi:mRNA interferase RelE/StbE